MRTFLILLALALPAAALDLTVGSKVDATMEQLRAAIIQKGKANACPIGVSKTGVVISNPTGFALSDNDIPSIAESRRIIADWKAKQGTILNTTTNR